MLTADPATLRAAARSMLAAVLSCRENMSNSGVVARIAGEAINATAYLPNMATEAFLGCVSKTALERAAREAGVRTGARAKDTRWEMVERFRNGTYTYPGAAFTVTEADLEEAKGWSARQPLYLPGNTPGSDDDADDAMPRDDAWTDASGHDDLDGYPMAAE